jgi:hypothetical protein
MITSSSNLASAAGGDVTTRRPIRFYREIQLLRYLFCIVKQLDSLSTSEWLEVNVSNECISKVGARLYTNWLHQTYIIQNSCAAWWNKFGGTEWHVRHESAWQNTNITLHSILVIQYNTIFILYLFLKLLFIPVFTCTCYQLQIHVSLK